MDCIAFYGKGGIGKSTVASAVSLALAKMGKRVLLIGCDPKHDSTLLLTGGRLIPTVIEQLFSKPTGALRAEDIIYKGELGVDCIEAGGPEPGVGCGGRAVSRTLEVVEQLGIVSENHYDVVVFDVLGDVVCGGFAAPLRSAFAPKVVIVLSEELAAAYAANNIVKGVLRFYENGICVAGAVLNLRDNRANQEAVKNFLQAISVNLLSVLARDPAIQQAESSGANVVISAPNSKATRTIALLAENLLTIKKDKCLRPTPITFEQIRAILQRKNK